MKTSFNKNQIRIGGLFGIPLTFDFSWFLVVILITWMLAGSYFPNEYKGWSNYLYWLVGGVTAVLFFFSVLLHEVGHSLTAKYYKHKVKQQPIKQLQLL